MLMSLGMFVFELPTLAFEELNRRTAWRHAGSDRFGARAANQFLGPGPESITLSGTHAAEIAGNSEAFETLRRMGDQGEAWPLVDGTGRVHGRFVIASVDERQSYFHVDGVPRKTDFTLELGRID